MLDGDLNRKRYSSSRGVGVPDCHRELFKAGQADMVEMVILSFASIEGRVTRSWFDRTRQLFFVESDTGDPERPALAMLASEGVSHA